MLDQYQSVFASDYHSVAFKLANNCPICEGEGTPLGDAASIDKNKSLKIKLLSCSDCNHWWHNPLPVQECLNSLYEEGSNSVIGSGWSDATKNDLSKPEKMLLALEKGYETKNYLEVGVGKALLFNQFLSKGINCFGIELGQWGKNNPNIFPDLDDVPVSMQYDCMVAMDVLEHLSDPKVMLKKLSALANAKTRLYLSFPNNQSLRARFYKTKWRMILPYGHIHYFSYESAKKMLGDSGWKITTAQKTDLYKYERLRKIRRLFKPNEWLKIMREYFGWGDQWFITAEIL